MKIQSVSPIFLLIPCLVFFFSCAQVVAPTGGERDMLPPEIVASKPPNEKLNFDEEEIVLEFNEYVKLVKLKDELIVSPPLKYRLETEIKGKKLKLSFKDTLKENTTYVLNFGNAIVDITENNPIGNFQYVFSTGSEIDTFRVSGRVIDAFETKAKSGVLVMLYDVFEDSIPMKEVPNYIARTNAEGAYQLSNIKEGKYKVFVLNDENDNFLFDRADEEIAFDTLPLQVDKNIEKQNYYLFQEDREKQFVDKQIENGSYILFKMNKPFENLAFEGIDTNLNEILLYREIGLKRDSLSLWFKEMEERRINVVLDDSLDFRDSLGIVLDSNRIKLKLQFPQVDNYFQPTYINSSIPIKAVEQEGIHLWDADSNKLDFEFSETNSKLKWLLDFERKPGARYYLFIEPGVVSDIYGNKNDSIQKVFVLNEVEDFGKLMVKVDAETSHKQLIQLLDSEGKVLRQKEIKNNQVEFNYLKGGKYRLKLILDRNENGKWDTGEYLQKILPEETLLFDEPITIRANWDKEINWKIK